MTWYGTFFLWFWWIFCYLSFLLILTGYNNPITGNAIISLLSKLSALERYDQSIWNYLVCVQNWISSNWQQLRLICRFSELNLSGLKLSKNVVDKLCHLANASSLSGLMLGGTGIGTVSELCVWERSLLDSSISIHVNFSCLVSKFGHNSQDAALQITETLSNSNQELVKLDLSCCALSSGYAGRLSANINLISCVLELNIGGNPIMQVVWLIFYSIPYSFSLF